MAHPARSLHSGRAEHILPLGVPFNHQHFFLQQLAAQAFAGLDQHERYLKDESGTNQEKDCQEIVNSMSLLKRYF